MSNVPSLKIFQENAVNEIVSAVETIFNDSNSANSRKIVLDSPTGSGKTRMIADIIERSLPDALTIVLSPGAGNLEQQTHDALKFFLAPSEQVHVEEMTIPLFQNAAAPGTVVVKNWEALTTRNKKTGEYSVYLTKDGDNNNLFDWITASANADVPVAIVIDEAHYGNGKDAPAIQGFLTDVSRAVKSGGGVEPVIIEASATPILNEKEHPRLYYKVGRPDVVAEGLMRKRGVLNDGVEEVIDALADPISVSAETVLLDGALDKSNELNVEYRNVGSDQHALIAVQIPNSTPGKEAQDRVISHFEKQGLTIENGQVAVFTSQTKTAIIDDISDADSPIRVLIYKQGISTGWDCPRAQILVGFRHINSLIFSAQNLGRFSRSTEARHYTLDESPTSEKLNNFYVYSNISDMGLGYHPGKVKDGSSLPVDEFLKGDLDLLNEFNSYNLPVSSLVRTQKSSQNEAKIEMLLQKTLKEQDHALSEVSDKGILLHVGSVDTATFLDEDAEEATFSAVSTQVGRASHEVLSRWNDALLGTITQNGDIANKSPLVKLFSRRLLTFYTTRLRRLGTVQNELRPVRVISRMMQPENYAAIEKTLVHALQQEEMVALKESYQNDPEESFPASTRRFRFGGNFSLPHNLMVTKQDSVKVDNVLAGNFIYRDTTDGATTSWRQEELSAPEASFEKFLLEYTNTSPLWELAGIHKNAPYANKENFSIALSVREKNSEGKEHEMTQNFFPDYIIFLKNSETGKTVPIVVEVKGKNPEGQDPSVAAKARAAKQYSKETGLPFIVATQKETGSETFNVYGESFALDTYLERAEVRDAVVEKFPAYKFNMHPIPTELDWMNRLGHEEQK